MSLLVDNIYFNGEKATDMADYYVLANLAPSECSLL